MLVVLRVLRGHGLLTLRPRPTPHPARSALEELGPVFQKFGQVVALGATGEGPTPTG